MHHPHSVLMHFERDAFSREAGTYRIPLPLSERMLCLSPEFIQAQERLSVFSVRYPAAAWIFVEVAVKSKSISDTKSFHNDKARAIDKAKEMIPISAKYV
jgi:hypothetical protein